MYLSFFFSNNQQLHLKQSVTQILALMEECAKKQDPIRILIASALTLASKEGFVTVRNAIGAYMGERDFFKRQVQMRWIEIMEIMTQVGILAGFLNAPMKLKMG